MLIISINQGSLIHHKKKPIKNSAFFRVGLVGDYFKGDNEDFGGVCRH